ncbi:MAG: hypothetical protein IPP72_12140 [Chitinophagaceae bacterium]|nr:hypothetical protein [Chitinophagaceae bacterium]
MTLRLLIFMVTVFVANDVISQNQTTRPAILWQKCLGGSGDDKANDVLLTTDGGMILAGTSASSDGDVTGNHGGYDGWVVKLNAAGTKQWQRAVGGSSNDGFNTIIKTSDGGYLCVGYTSSNDGDVSGLHNQAGNVYRRDSWVVKLSDSGTVVWSNVYGGSHDDVANSALEISDGNYAIIGTAVSNNGDVHVVDSFEYYKGWVFKISTTGNLIWEKSFGEDEPYATGGGFGYNIIETDNHELLAYISGNRDYDSVVITPSDNWPGEWDTTVYPRIYSSPGILYKLAISNGASSYFDQTKGDGYFSMMKAAHGLYFSYLHYSFKIAPGYVNGYCMDETSEIAYRDNSTGKLEAVRTYLERCEDIGSTLFSRFSPASMHGTYQLADGQILQAGTQSGQSMCGGATGDGTLRFAGINGYYYGGSSDDVFNAVRGFPNGYEMLCAGYTRSVDGDLLGLRGDPQLECMGTLDDDFWMLKLSITPNRISGNLFLDENNNNIKDVNEHAFNKAMVKPINPVLKSVQDFQWPLRSIDRYRNLYNKTPFIQSCFL